MTDLPLVSIVTPSYQQAAYLEHTLRSVLEQDYLRIEYWVIDGGSTDGSVEIIQKYADRLAGWVSERDSGQAEAINKGFARATGEIVAWLNSDDAYLPGAVASAVRALQADPDLALVYGDVRSIDGDGRLINVMRYDDWDLADLMSFHILGQPGVFMRRSALEKAGGLDPSYHLLLDHHLWLRVASHGGMRYVREEWAEARFHPQAKNVALAARFGEEAYRIARWLEQDPRLDDPYGMNRRKLWAGAHRINARYLLDGGQPREALRAYGRGLAAHAPTVLPEWHRMVYAVLSMIGLGRLGGVYRGVRRRLMLAGRARETGTGND